MKNIALPDHFKPLDPRQEKTIDEWAGRIQALLREQAPDEECDCCGTSSFTWHCITSGIGDTMYITCGKHKLICIIDDNDELMTDESLLG